MYQKMNPHEYLCLQLRLEGKEIVDGNLLRQVEIVPGEYIPLMMSVRFANEGTITYWDGSLRTDLQKELATRVGDTKFPKFVSLFEFLEAQNISFDIGYYKTYLFPAQPEYRCLDVKCASRQNPFVQSFGFGDFAEDVYGIERDGKIVSACVSIRENSQCGEAWVYTDPRYRKQGFAQQTVKAWAQQMSKAGKVPFYSHAIENIASANLAKRLELQPIFEEVSISDMNV
jgi:GNAT superfamily N-acetyltransferase